jgi:hypothetical protein
MPYRCARIGLRSAGQGDRLPRPGKPARRSCRSDALRWSRTAGVLRLPRREYREACAPRAQLACTRALKAWLGNPILDMDPE